MSSYSRKNISSTHKRIRGLVRKTPCTVSPYLSQMVSKSCSHLKAVEIVLKCENFQISGSFKYRGALNKLLQLSRDQLNHGIATYSTGQATAAAELQEQVRSSGIGELDAVIAPCGGGSLLSGCAAWFHGSPTQVWGAEPLVDGPGLYASLEAGILLPKKKAIGSTIADGQRTTLSAESWAILSGSSALRGSIAITETQISEALTLYYKEFGDVIEPSSAVAIAACVAVAQHQVPKHCAAGVTKIGVILSGGNISADVFDNLRNKGGEDDN
ncbi:hypothetical protein ACHAO9_008473 [Fusarium lateritium]